MNSNKSVTAYFVYDPDQVYYTLTTSVSPSGSGYVSLSPSGGTYTSGTSVTLTANPATDYKFDHWGGDATGTSTSVTITMDSHKNVIAYFVYDPDQYTLTTSVSPSGSGYVTLSPSGGTYDAGTQVTIEAVKYSGYEFYEWEVVGSGYLTSNPITVTVNGNAELIAHFVRSGYEIHTSVSPEGSGYVILDPPGGTYTHGTEVTLTAYHYSGYEFNYWGGDSTNYSNPLTITLGYSDRDIIAYFETDPVVRRAFVVGISDYPGFVNDLHAPALAAMRMSDTLANSRFEPSNIGFDFIVCLTNDYVTIGRILFDMPEIFSDANRNDVSYFYFAGHGGIDSTGAYISAHDGHVSVDWLEQALKPLDGKVVVFIDACNSGGFIGKEKKEVNKNDIIDFNNEVINIFSQSRVKHLADDSYGEKYQVLTSCMGSQGSWEYYQSDEGWYMLFTKTLCEGIGYENSFSADTDIEGNGDTKVSLHEAHFYVVNHIEENLPPDRELWQDVRIHPWGSEFTITEY